MLKIIYSISIISGTVIGAGLFALPYLTLKVGIPIMIVYLVVLGFIAILIHSFFAEISLKTKDFIRLPGFAFHYLGKWGYRIALFSGIIGLFGSGLAYLIIGGEFLEALLSPYFGGNPSLYTILYFGIGSFVIFFGIKIFDKIQFWGVVLFLLALIGIYYKGNSYLDLSNLSISKIDYSYLFLPYGIVLFSLWGLSLIPETEEFLGEKRNYLTKIVPFAIIIPIVVYVFFIVLILGIMGENTAESALVGLQDFLGNSITRIVLFFGLMTTFTSFIALGLTLKKIFWYDLKISKNLAWFITCFVPLFLFLLGFNNFIMVLALVGGIMLAIDGILVSLMYQKTDANKKFITYPVIIALIGGIIYELIYSFNFFK